MIQFAIGIPPNVAGQSGESTDICGLIFIAICWGVTMWKLGAIVDWFATNKRTKNFWD